MLSRWWPCQFSAGDDGETKHENPASLRGFGGPEQNAERFPRYRRRARNLTARSGPDRCRRRRRRRRRKIRRRRRKIRRRRRRWRSVGGGGRGSVARRLACCRRLAVIVRRPSDRPRCPSFSGTLRAFLSTPSTVSPTFERFPDDDDDDHSHVQQAVVYRIAR